MEFGEPFSKLGGLMSSLRVPVISPLSAVGSLPPDFDAVSANS